MKAVLQLKYGAPESLKVSEVPKPQIGDTDILVRVEAATVNRTDCGRLRASPFITRLVTGLLKPRANISGTDFSGVVEKTGSQVKGFKKGDRVFGFNDNGLLSHAQYVKLTGKTPVCKIPNSISFEQAASSAEAFHYAYNMVNKVSLNASQKVMVNGGTGAIGSALIQILKTYGATITATAPKEYIETVKNLGAHRVIDYTSEDFTNDKEIYAFVFDAVGKSRFSLCKKLLVKNGVYISTELGPAAENTYLPLITKFFGDKKILFPFPFNIPKSLELAGTLLEKGRFKPLIDRKFSIDNIVEAFNYVESGRKIGNVILTPNQ